MRETRPSGSEGGGTRDHSALPTPIEGRGRLFSNLERDAGMNP